jgi:AcrR family transcriptional regulator
MELYAERGFDQTTVAQIAERAGLTKRTFFRHYADKRDVLFAGTAMLQEAAVDAVTQAPRSLPPVAAVSLALEAAARTIQEHADVAKVRQSIIDAHTELQERELVKLAGLAANLAEALRGRGLDVWTARLAAEAGVSAFRVAFARWIAQDAQGELADVLTESMKELAATLTAADVAAGRIEEY